MRGRAWKAVLTLVLLIISLWFLWPTIRLMAMSQEAKEENPALVNSLQLKGIRLGLDLRGGTNLMFEVDTTKLPEDMTEIPLEEAVEVIRSRVDQFGVAEPSIQPAGDRRIIIELPGIQDIEGAKQLIQETALLEFRLVLDERDVKRFVEGMDLLLSEHPEYIELAQKGLSVEQIETEIEKSTKSDTSSKLAETKDTTSKPSKEEIEPFRKTIESTLQKTDSSKLAKTVQTKADTVIKGKAIFEREDRESTYIPPVSIEGEELPETSRPFSSMIYVRRNNILVVGKYVDLVDKLIQLPKIRKIVPKSILLWDSNFDEFEGLRVKVLYLLRDKREITGAFLKSATWRLGGGKNPNEPTVFLDFNSDGARIFSAVTGANINKRLAIILSDKVYSAPVIETKIPNGKATIVGIREIDEAKRITIILRAGSLPVPLNIIEERTVGPSLGEDSIKRGTRAAVFGLILIMIFMVMYYKFAGIVADVALILNIIFVMAALSVLNAALTLPGIAGLILTIGIAVDANVLIYERIREEIKAGRTLRMAIDAGYSRAIITIIDANITTLIAAAVLFYLGSGPIRGFATTLGLGLIISMYTAIIVTRMIFDWYVSAFSKETISI